MARSEVTRTARVRITQPPAPRPRQKRYASGYSPGTIAKAKQWGIAPHEVSGWQIQDSRVDELVEFHRRPGSLVSEGVRRLAAAMLEQARADLAYERRPRQDWWGKVGKDYRPDPGGARAWFARDDDATLGFVWVCQVLRYDPQAVRAANRRPGRRDRRFR